MENIFQLGRQKVYSLEEVQQLIPLVVKITRTYSTQVEALIRQIDAIGSSNEEATQRLEKQINELVETWQNKIEKLGGLSRGLWLADFDSGDGYYCWKFPEERIEYWHGYSEGFSGRVKLPGSGLQKSHLASDPEITL